MMQELVDDRIILVTIDVEDWFQVENFKAYIPYATWSSRELRVEKNTHEILNLLNETSSKIKATFFVLGWIAERCPELIREICRRGHEVASHGFSHNLSYLLTNDELLQDLIKSKQLLEDITGGEILGYRAPSFSVTDGILDSVQKAGYHYDSSYNSYEGHGRYGSLSLPKVERQDLPIYNLSPSFYEIPVSNLRVGNKVIPWGGGGYFRLMPHFLHMAGVKHILKKNGCYTFYLHPWEIDPEQPRVSNAKYSFRFRHYVNLSRTKGKLEKFLTNNAEHSFLTCKELIKRQ